MYRKKRQNNFQISSYLIQQLQIRLIDRMEIKIETQYANPPNKFASVFPALFHTNKTTFTQQQQGLSGYKTSGISDNSHKKQDQGKFLNRMKQAREMILYHKKRSTQRKKKQDDSEESQTYQFSKFKTQDDQHMHSKLNIGELKNQHSCTLHTDYDALGNKQTVSNDKYCGKFFRNSNREIKKKCLFFGSTDVKSYRNKIYLMKTTHCPQGDQFNGVIEGKGNPSKKKSKNDKLLMHLDLSQELINQNCCKLVQKLIKCRKLKNGESPQKISEDNEDKLSQKQQTLKNIIHDSKQTEKKSKISHKSTTLSSWKKSLNKLKIQFQFQRNLQNKKQRCRMTLRKAQQILNTTPTTIMQTTSNQETMKKELTTTKINKKKQMVNLLNIKNNNTDRYSSSQQLWKTRYPKSPQKNASKLKVVKKQKQFLTNKTKSTFEHYDANFKLEGWNMKQAQSFQYDMQNTEICRRVF